jgi:acetyl-CoA synthetase
MPGVTAATARAVATDRSYALPKAARFVYSHAIRRRQRAAALTREGPGMSKTHAVPDAFAAAARVDAERYRREYQRSITDSAGYWGEIGRRLDWIRPYTQVRDVSFDAADFRIRWYADGALNVSANCLDRHLAARGDKTAILWEGDDPAESKRLSYRELHAQVCRLANVLKALGVAQGDRVTIYLPMIPEAAIAMLACARIGAVHSVVFGGFSPEALIGRIADCGSKLVITADEGLRGGKRIPLKANVDAALAGGRLDGVEHVLVVRRTGGQVPFDARRDRWYHELVAAAADTCEPVAVGAEDPLFILYTSGSTGKPKGVLHTTGGYLVYASYSHECVFDLREDDVYWCTADVGWVTGHSYIVYGPLANGATSLMFEGVPNYPDVSRFWQVVDKHRVTIFYTAPTAIRALMRDGDEPVRRTQRRTLRLLGTVGEPINPEAWEWYHRVVGDGRCPIVDTWWQTETGGILITPFPGAFALKPGAAQRPFFGVQPALVDGEGRPLDGAAEGNLVLLDSWPGQMRTVYGDHQRFIDTYFKTFPGRYFTGDGARRDGDGEWWITGRVDDVINVSGHRLGTAEVESALVAHRAVAEAAVVGAPHAIKGQGIYAYVTLKAGVEASETLRRELVGEVRREIGAIASPDWIQWAPGLPKTRSGKIMRRILRKIAANEHEQLGDISTLADPSVVATLVAERRNR